MNIFENTLNLPELTINSRMFPVDPNATAILYQAAIIDVNETVTGYRNMVGITSSILTSQQIVNSLANPMTQAETNAANRAANSRAHAKAIPSWASWTEQEALDWIQANIGTPLATPIPPNPMTVQQIRAVLVSFVNIMNNMNAVQTAMARMEIAVRDEIWPDLQDV
jgi:hypothetical protein